MPRFITPAARAFSDYWFSLPRQGLMPTLSDFLDRPHPVFQPQIAITDVFSDTEIRYRLVGTDLVHGFGRERPCGARAMITAATSRDREAVFETACFPVSRGDHPPVVIGYNETLTKLEEEENVIQFLAMADSEWIELS